MSLVVSLWGAAANMVRAQQYVDPLDPSVEIAQPKGVPVFVETADGGSHKFNTELAITPEARARGLMFRDGIAQGDSMLFVYPRARRMSFWNKNVRMPIDIIFIRVTGKIANIVENVPPHTEESRKSLGRTIAVLELAAGEAARLGIKKGDLVRHPLLKNALESQLGAEFMIEQPEVK